MCVKPMRMTMMMVLWSGLAGMACVSAVARGAEEKGRADLLGLLPGEALLYVELNQPGRHLARLVESAGLMLKGGGAAQPSDDAPPPFGISPRLLAALETVEGAALAVTDFEARQGMPEGLLILDPGRADLVYGLIETALSGAAAAGEVRLAEPIEASSVYETPAGPVALTGELVVFGSSRALVAGALEKLKRGARAAPELEAKRKASKDSLIFAFVDARAAVMRFKAEAFKGQEPDEEYRIAQALCDLESLRWASLDITTSDSELAVSFELMLDEENQAVAYHLLRTPPVGKEALRAAPAGAAAVAAFALGALEESSASREAAPGKLAGPLTGLDIGRELFANVKEVVGFVLPWATEPAARGRPPIPDAGLVLTARDAAKSAALWRQVLGLAALFAQPRGEAPKTDKVDGHEVRVYAFPDGFEAQLAALPDRIVLATSRAAVSQAIAAANGKGSAFDDPALAAAWSACGEGKSKVLVVHAARVLEMAAPFAGLRGGELEGAREALSGAAVTLATDEGAASLRVRAAAAVPRVDQLLRRLLERRQVSTKGRGPAREKAPTAPAAKF